MKLNQISLLIAIILNTSISLAAIPSNYSQLKKCQMQGEKVVAPYTYIDNVRASVDLNIDFKMACVEYTLVRNKNIQVDQDLIPLLVKNLSNPKHMNISSLQIHQILTGE